MPRADQRKGRADFAAQVEHLDQVAATAGLRRGHTVPELASMLRVGQDRVRGWIKSGALRAVNTSDVTCGRPRYVVLPADLDAFVRGRACGPAPKPVRRKRKPDVKDYFPD